MWDELIDRAARELTSAEPSSDLKARVMAAIDAAPPRRWRPLVLVPIAAALAVLIAVGVVVISRLDVARRPQSSEHAAARPNVRESDVARRLQPSGPSDVARRREPSAISRTQSSRPPSEIDALAPPRLDVAPVPVTSLQVPGSLDVPTLTVTSIDVAPLSSEERKPEGEIK